MKEMRLLLHISHNDRWGIALGNEKKLFYQRP